MFSGALSVLQEYSGATEDDRASSDVVAERHRHFHVSPRDQVHRCRVWAGLKGQEVKPSGYFDDLNLDGLDGREMRTSKETVR